MKFFRLGTIIFLIILAGGTTYAARQIFFDQKSLEKQGDFSLAELDFLKEMGLLVSPGHQKTGPGTSLAGLASQGKSVNYQEQDYLVPKSPLLLEQQINREDASFNVLATKLDPDSQTYQLAFKLENKTSQIKEFFLLPISDPDQMQFKEITGQIGSQKVIKDSYDIIKQPLSELYDISQHQKELRPDLSQAYQDIEHNGYQAQPIRLSLAPKSSLLGQSQWKVQMTDYFLDPVYFLIVGSAGGIKDDLYQEVDLNAVPAPNQNEDFREMINKEPVKFWQAQSEDNPLPYGAPIKRNIQDEAPLQYTVNDKTISFKPKSLSWQTTTGQEVIIKQDPDSALAETIDNAFEIDGQSEIEDEARGIVYQDIFGPGINIGLLTYETLWRKILKISSLDNLGPIPEKAKYLTIEFEVATDFQFKDWDKQGIFEINKDFKIDDYSQIMTAKAWDSSLEITQDDLEQAIIDQANILQEKKRARSFFENRGGKLYYTKQISVDWLKQAQFPVYTDADIAYGTAEQFASGTAIIVRVAEINTDKFVVCHADDVDDAGKCIVASVSGTDMTWGGESSFTADVICAQIDYSSLDVCKLATDKFVVVYTDDSSLDDGFARAVDVSGETIQTWGNPVEIVNADMEHATCAQMNTNKFVTCYDDEADNDTGKCIVSTVDDSEVITPGTAEAIDGAGGNTDYNPRYSDVAQLTTDTFVFCFRAEDDTYGYCVAGSAIGGTDITWGAVNGFSGTNAVNYVGVTVSAADKFTVSYEDVGQTQGESLAATVSSLTITYGTAAVHETGSTENNRNASINSSFIVVAYSDNTDSGQGKSNRCAVNYTTRTITPSTPQTFETADAGGNADRGLDIELISSNKIVICYQDDTNNDVGECIVGDVSTNSAPSINSITDFPDPQSVGGDITFELDWSDQDANDQVKIHICKGTTITGQTCDSPGSWCDTASFSTSNPLSCHYTAQAADVGGSPNSYYAFVCDDDDSCSPYTEGAFSATSQSDSVIIKGGVKIKGGTTIK